MAKLISTVVAVVLLLAILQWVFAPLWPFVLFIGLPVSVYVGILASFREAERARMEFTLASLSLQALLNAALVLFLFTLVAILFRILYWMVFG